MVTLTSKSASRVCDAGSRLDGTVVDVENQEGRKFPSCSTEACYAKLVACA